MGVRDRRVHKVVVRELRGGMPFVGVEVVVAAVGTKRPQIVSMACDQARAHRGIPARQALTGTVMAPPVGSSL
jgi:hypothetical protein